MNHFAEPLSELEKHYESSARISTGVLLAGDFNAHHSLWDEFSKPDSIGKNIAKFLSDRFTIANDGYPTFTKKGVHTAIDITAFCGSIVVDNWYHFMPVGRTHHDVLEYDIIATAAEPLNLHSIRDIGSPSDRRAPKVNW